MFEFQRSVTTVAEEGLSFAVQRAFILTELFDQVAGAKE